MDMKRFGLLLIVLACTLPLSAQSADSLPLRRTIFDLLQTAGPYGNTVTIVQPAALKQAVQTQITQNESKKLQGYRIRIFNSNAQTARTAGQSLKEEFELLFPTTRAYFKYENPDWRVTVGDFRTKSEATRFHKELTAFYQYRTAVVVRELIELPPL